MSGFNADWLALREPLDDQARAPALARVLRLRFAGRSPLRILDLATGTGANLRWLAPRLGGSQEWLLFDQDPQLLAALPAAITGWARAQGYPQARSGDAIRVHGPTFGALVRTRRLDLAAGLSELPLARHPLVTASALLDLVSEDWLSALGARARAAQSALLFALTYDGRIELHPIEPADERIRALVNRHQRGNKGFGPAMGPSAVGRASNLFEALGYRVWTRVSDWRIDPSHAAAQEELLAGWAGAARAMDPAAGAEIDGWLARRLTHVAIGRAGMRVGHQDLLALPPP